MKQKQKFSLIALRIKTNTKIQHSSLFSFFSCMLCVRFFFLLFCIFILLFRTEFHSCPLCTIAINVVECNYKLQITYTVSNKMHWTWYKMKLQYTNYNQSIAFALFLQSTKQNNIGKWKCLLSIVDKV